MIKDEAMRDISRKAASTYRFVIFDEKDGKMSIAMEDPTDFQALEAVKFIAKKKNAVPEIFLASSEGIDKLLGGSSAVQAEIGGALKEFNKELQDVQQDIGGKEGKDIERIVEEAPVKKVVAVTIRHAIEGHASDIHIEPTETDLRIRYRIDGKLHTTLVLPRKVHPAILSRIKILSNLKIDESRLPQDGRFSANIDNKAYDFRVSTMPTSFGEKLAMRILDKSAGAPSYSDLGMSKPMQMLMKDAISAPHGIVLLTGPTGSGKSTTLFSSLSQLNSTELNIVTLEDPVEYEIDGVNQTQTQAEIGLTFASGLRSILRQDPDVIMVGEIRDKETAELAVHASLTGHLVLSTIHTNDAIGAVPRLIDMGIDAFLLAASVRLLAAQRLVGKLCPHCKEEATIPDRIKEKISAVLAGIPDQYLENDNQRNPQVFYQSPGCPKCQESGSVGRIAIFEVVPITRELRGAINNAEQYDTLVSTAKSDAVITMQQDGLLKVLAGEVRGADVVRITTEAQR